MTINPGEIVQFWAISCLIIDGVLLFFFGPPTDPRDPNNCEDWN